MSGKKNIQPPYRIFGGDYIDAETIQQMDEAIRLPVSIRGALMPDAHVGYGLPIGGVLATYNSIIPFGVGMDIGCRMCLSIYKIEPHRIDKSRSQIIDLLVKYTRFGRAEFDDIAEHEILEHKAFREVPFLRTLKDIAWRQLGTSGHGNHFVDIGILHLDIDSDTLDLAKGSYFAILSHSGSRNMGAQIARHYTQVAQEKRGMTGGNRNLAWLNLDEEEGEEYWEAMNLAGEYSATNHRIIHKRLAGALGESPIKIVENHHNFAWRDPEEKHIIIHRKGATPAEKGLLAIIPGSMTAPAYIVEGLGNETSLQSAAHGAGRLLSRNRAKKEFSRKHLDHELEKHNVTLIGGDTDEAPMAYKDIDRVMNYQRELVQTIGKFFPRIVRMA